MTVYTGRGDDGETDLRGNDRISKADLRIETYGTIDELNALVGMVRPTGFDDVDEMLAMVQNHLHVIQADLATPSESDSAPRIDSKHIDTIEQWIDECEEELTPLDSFILPGGGNAGAKLHHSRTVCRRAERRVVKLTQREPVNSVIQTYLNRLSDLLFVLARVVNDRNGVVEESPTY